MSFGERLVKPVSINFNELDDYTDLRLIVGVYIVQRNLIDSEDIE